ncbi:MAG: addiction module protein [Kiritimatiellia bacterium]
MQITVEKIYKEAVTLPPKERASLAEAIWDSLGESHTFLSDISDEKAVSLASQREAEIDEGKVSALSHAELMERLA